MLTFAISLPIVAIIVAIIVLPCCGIYLYKYKGEEPVIRCPKCGQYNKRTEMYCRDCGYKIPKK